MNKAGKNRSSIAESVKNLSLVAGAIAGAAKSVLELLELLHRGSK
jgi:hypothetical protein